MQLHQVFAGVIGISSDQFGIGPTDIVEIVLFQNVTTSRLRHDNVVAFADSVRQCLDILLSNLGEVIDISTVQERRTTTLGCVSQRAFDAVAFVHLDQVMTDFRCLILNKTSWE